MPRRVFTARDLAPLRRATRQIVEKDPDAALVVAAAGPFKRRIPKAEHVEWSEARLPVEVASSRRPEGVPLNQITDAIREEAPGLTGASVTPGGVALKFKKPPTAAQRRRIQALLADGPRLEAMRPAIRGVDAGERTAESDQDLRRVLHDPATTDAAWLRAFRRFALEHLVEPPSE